MSVTQGVLTCYTAPPAVQFCCMILIRCSSSVLPHVFSSMILSWGQQHDVFKVTANQAAVLLPVSFMAVTTCVQ